MHTPAAAEYPTVKGILGFHPLGPMPGMRGKVVYALNPEITEIEGWPDETHFTVTGCFDGEQFRVRDDNGIDSLLPAAIMYMGFQMWHRGEWRHIAEPEVLEWFKHLGNMLAPFTEPEKRTAAEQIWSLYETFRIKKSKEPFHGFSYNPPPVALLSKA